MADHLIINVEEQQAKRLYDAGLPGLARTAIVRSSSLDDETPFDELLDFRTRPLTKEEKAQRKDAAADLEIVEMRAQRDALLSGSDWTQLPDAGVDTKAWAAYRKKLRDLPDTSETGKVKWPKPPRVE